MRVKKKIDIWIFLYLYLIFQTNLQSLTNGVLHTVVKYSDEMIVVILLIMIILKAIRREVKFNKLEAGILISFGIFEILGIIYGMLGGYQKFLYVLVDAFTCAKFLIVFFAAYKLTNDELENTWCLRMNNLSQFMAVLLFVLVIHDLLFSPFFEKAEYRYFTYSIKLFFSHPEGLARAAAGFIYPLAYNMKFGKKNMKYILMLCFVMFFTFRSKAIAAMAIIVFIYIYRFFFKQKKVYTLFAMMGIIALLVGADQLKYYYSHALISRTKLLTDAIKIANMMFPLGSGFGSFGSNVAADFNSLLYNEMGYFDTANPWAEKAFLNDAFWPIVISQTGWIGTFFFAISILGLLVIGIKLYRKKFFSSWIFLSVIMYDLVSTAASSAFFHPLALSSYIFLGLILSSAKLNKGDKE